MKTDRLKYKLIAFSILALLLIVLAFFSESLCPYDPYEQNLAMAKAAPSAEHLLGTDRFGRDMLSRIIAGNYTSIFSTLHWSALSPCLAVSSAFSVPGRDDG